MKNQEKINKYLQNSKLNSKNRVLQKVFEAIIDLSNKILDAESQKSVISYSNKIVMVIDTVIASIRPEGDVSHKFIELMKKFRSDILKAGYQKDYREEFTKISKEFQKLKEIL
ncbi:hypothetical protein GUI12_00665 [Anaplasmataceae bacterium AB001_6]|nr:hypothetical protein GUI12_00665 [Anaplasmataceae bacterium AB001_6]